MNGCCFIGHKNCPDNIKPFVFKTVEDLVLNKEVKRFYVGTQGNFDKIVYEVLIELEKKYSIQLFVVLAYLNNNKQLNYYEDNKTIFPDELTNSPPRFAILKRNNYMINESEYVVCYLNNPFSNSYKNIEYAINRKKTIINLGEYNI